MKIEPILILLSLVFSVAALIVTFSTGSHNAHDRVQPCEVTQPDPFLGAKVIKI